VLCALFQEEGKQILEAKDEDLLLTGRSLFLVDLTEHLEGQLQRKDSEEPCSLADKEAVVAVACDLTEDDEHKTNLGTLHAPEGV